MNAGHGLIAIMIAVLILDLALFASLIEPELHAQTIALQTIAANSKPPVSIKLAGFSDEARQSLSDALHEQAPTGYSTLSPISTASSCGSEADLGPDKLGEFVLKAILQKHIKHKAVKP